MLPTTVPDRPSAYDKAVKLLARRPHFRAEVERKLASRGYPTSEVADAVARLAREGVLDDAREARAYATARLRRGGFGARRLEAELRRRGVARDDAAAAVAALCAPDDLALARSEAERWAGRRGGSPAALARHLDRRGFSRRAILRVLDELGGEEGLAGASPDEPA